MQERLTVQVRPAWVPDETVSNCKNCKKDFGLFTRKHHCRRCGDIFCDSCASKTTELPQNMCYPDPQRVCVKCNSTSLSEVKQRADTIDSTMNAVRFFIRSYGRIIPTLYIGGRDTNFKVMLLMENDLRQQFILTVFSPNKTYPGSSETFTKILQTIKHPYIYPNDEVGNIEGGKVAIIRKFSNQGSLRDALHGTQPRQNFAVKYQSTNTVRQLSDREIATFGTFVLEALIYLQIHGVPPLNLHCGNLIFVEDKLCLTDIENALLDTPPRLNPSKINTSTILFGLLLVEMATGRRVKSLDDISTAAASGSLSLSLPVLQLINTIANETKREEDFSFHEVIVLPFFAQYQRPQLPETETFNFDPRLLVQKYLFSDDSRKLTNSEELLEKDEDYFQQEIMILTHLQKFKLFCVQPKIYKSDVILTGVAFCDLEPQMDKVTAAIAASTKKLVDISAIKYASKDELMFYASEHGIIGQIKEFCRPKNKVLIMKNILNYMTMALLHKQEELSSLYLETIIQSFPDLMKKIMHDKQKLSDLANLIVLAAQNGMNKFLTSILSYFPNLVNARNVNGMAPVHAAAISANISTLRVLIEKFQANADIRDKMGMTPLHFASQSGNFDLVEYLSKFSDINATTNNRETPLDLAYARQASNRKLIRKLTLLQASSTRVCYINSKLPTNLLLAVFAQLTFRYATTCCLTCKQWKTTVAEDALSKAWFKKAFPGSFSALPPAVPTWRELLVRQVGGDKFSKKFNDMQIPNTTIRVIRSVYVPAFDKSTDAEIINFLLKTLDLKIELKKRKKADVGEAMKTLMQYHMKNVVTTTEAVTAHLFLRIFEPDGIYFMGELVEKKSKYCVMVGASCMFHRIGVVISKDVT